MFDVKVGHSLVKLYLLTVEWLFCWNLGEMVQFDLHICLFSNGRGKKPPSRVVFSNHGMGWIPSLKLTARTWKCTVLKMKFLLRPGPFSGARWWFQIFFIFTPIWGKLTHFDKHIFQMGWNHQPGCFVSFREFWMFLVAQLFLSVGSHQVVFSWEFQGARHPVIPPEWSNYLLLGTL